MKKIFCLVFLFLLVINFLNCGDSKKEKVSKLVVYVPCGAAGPFNEFFDIFKEENPNIKLRPWIENIHPFLCCYS